MAFSLEHSVVRALLPYSHPMQLVDRIESYDAETDSIVAIKKVTHSDPFLRGHFPDFPIYPGVLTVGSLQQTSTLLMNLKELSNGGIPEKELREKIQDFEPPRSVVAENRIKQMGPLYPGDQIRLESQLKSEDENTATFTTRALDDDRSPVAKGTITVARSVEAMSDRV